MRRVRCEVSYPGVAWLFARTRRDEGQDIPADLRFCGVWRDDPVTGSVILIFESSTFADQPELTPPDRFPEWTPSFKRARPVRQLHCAQALTSDSLPKTRRPARECSRKLLE